jgi:hypothetical protein
LTQKQAIAAGFLSSNNSCTRRTVSASPAGSSTDRLSGGKAKKGTFEPYEKFIKSQSPYSDASDGCLRGRRSPSETFSSSKSLFIDPNTPSGFSDASCANPETPPPPSLSSDVNETIGIKGYHGPLPSEIAESQARWAGNGNSVPESYFLESQLSSEREPHMALKREFDQSKVNIESVPFYLEEPPQLPARLSTPRKRAQSLNVKAEQLTKKQKL